MKKFTVPMTILLVAALFLSGCRAIFPAPVDTPLPLEMIGTEVVETSAALATQTALNMPPSPIPSRTRRPTETPRPTQTPSITPSPTVPFVVNVPYLYSTPVPTQRPYESPTPLREPGITVPPPPTAIPIYGATMYTQKPANGTILPPGTPFTASWLFTNDTKRTWGLHEVDFVYFGGTPMQDPFYFVTGTPVPSIVYDVVDLPYDVPPNGRVTISVDMIAPSKPGPYSTTWLLHEGNRYYITVTLSITVK